MKKDRGVKMLKNKKLRHVRVKGLCSQNLLQKKSKKKQPGE